MRGTHGLREEPGKQKPRSCRTQELARSSARENERQKKSGLTVFWRRHDQSENGRMNSRSRFQESCRKSGERWTGHIDQSGLLDKFDSVPTLPVTAVHSIGRCNTI